MMQRYNIDVNYIPGLPRIPYRYGISAYEGVTAHCTDSSNHSGGDTPTNERAYEVSNWQNAFVHYFVGVEHGAPKIIQTADTNYKAWHAGHYANERFVGVELCMYSDPKLFAMAYDAYCYLLAKILLDKRLGVTPARPDGSGTLWSHKDVSDILGNSDHQDPISYLQSHGISWSKFISDVDAYYKWLDGGYQSKKSQAQAPAQPPLPLQYGDEGEWVKKLQKRLNITVDGIFKDQTEESVKMWQTVHDANGRVVKPFHGLEVDGIVGPRTYKALFPNG